MLNHVTIERAEILKLRWPGTHTERVNSETNSVGVKGHIMAEAEMLANDYAMPYDDQYNQQGREYKE